MNTHNNLRPTISIIPWFWRGVALLATLLIGLAAGMTLIAGALLGVAVLLLRPIGASATWARLMGLLLAPVASMRSSRRVTNPESRQRFPYGVAIACGTASALLLFNH